MPFKSEKQRKWMHVNKPEMAKDWEKKLAYSDRKEKKEKKMKREQRVKNLIKKIVREELAKMDEDSRGPCWKGYTQKGMKKKGNRMVPNCVKNEEITEAKETPVEVARRIVQNGQHEKYKGMMLDTFTASAIVKVYDAVNDSNKKKLDSLKLPKLVNVVWKLLKRVG